MLPRERRVLKDTAVSAVLERLTGLALGADDLRLIVSGCLVDRATPADGRQLPGGWQAVTIGPERVALSAHGAGPARRWLPPITGRGASITRSTPAAFRAWSAFACLGRRGSAKSDTAIDITARVEQLEVNTQINPRAWSVDVPSDADPMTLDELRSIAPLAQ